MQADRPLSRLNAAPPLQDQAGTPRNRQIAFSRWKASPLAVLIHIEKPRLTWHRPSSDSPLPRESYSRANDEVFGGVRLAPLADRGCLERRPDVLRVCGPAIRMSRTPFESGPRSM